MYFPDDMNFQYFFFATYPGFFLQALPIAILAGLVYYFVRMRRDHKSTRAERVWSVVLVCYLTGVICLTLALEIMGVLWDRVIYYDYEWSWPGIRMFCWDVNLIPNFFGCWNTENLFNLVLFLPFGILYPLSKWGGGWKRTLLVGFFWIAGIELLQPVFGRAFDINDIILNMGGIVLSASLFFFIQGMRRKRLENAAV